MELFGQKERLKEYESRARWLCDNHGFDPEELIPMPPHPEGYMIARWEPRWRAMARKLRDLDALLPALESR